MAAGVPGLALWDGPGGHVAAVVLPIAAYAALAPVLYYFFRSTWRELDAHALTARQKAAVEGRFDRRPAVVFAIAAFTLALQEYFGAGRFYFYEVEPWLRSLGRDPLTGIGLIDVRRWAELLSFAWWSLTRVLGYVVLPALAWKLLFRRDSVLDMGLRVGGFRKHAWIYGACLLVVVPLVVALSFTRDFATYYPFYKQCSRSWFDFIAWEALYFAQFFGLEFFFRGFLLAPLRNTLGAGAIFAMCVPYVMIHFGKPFLETCGALVAGVALGSLAMKTRSIYAGFLVHITVALLMDSMAIAHSPSGFPQTFWP